MASSPHEVARAVAAFERRYQERARAALSERPGPGPLEVVRVDQGSDGEGALVGWWCPPETAERHLVLPNPWDEREAIALYERHAWDVAGSLLAELGSFLDAVHGPRPAVYWESLLLPWLLALTTAVLDRRLYLVAARGLAPEARVAGTRAPESPGTLAESIIPLQTEAGNASLMTAMAPLLGLPSGPATPAAVPAHARLGHRGGSAVAALRHPRRAASAAAAVMVRLFLGGRSRRRRVALLQSHYAFAPGDVIRLWIANRGIRLTPRRPPGRAAPPQPGSARSRLAELEGASEAGRLVAALLPRLTPRTLLEGFSRLEAESLRLHGHPCALVVGNYWLDEHDNDFIGRCRAAGRPVSFLQHGGSYLQLRLHPFGRLERPPGTTFLSWGARGPGIEPAPVPKLERLRDSHRGGDRVVLVEWVHPPASYPVLFSSVPLANQGYDISARLGRLVERVRIDRRHLVLKRFPTFVEEVAREPALAGLESDAAGAAVAATDWMRSARLVVIPYPDTPLIEALLIGVPVIGLWSPDLWEMRDDAARPFEELTRLGVVHSDPAAAAAQLDRVYDHADEWWSDEGIQAARRRFLGRFAIGGDWRARWSQLIRAMEP